MQSTDRHSVVRNLHQQLGHRTPPMAPIASEPEIQQQNIMSWVDSLKRSRIVSWADESTTPLSGNLSVHNLSPNLNANIPDDELRLEYIAPAVVNGNLVGLLEHEDAESEKAFWNSSLACYVLGANPPISVMEGFVRRIWGSKGVQRVIYQGDGVFIVRFESVLERDEVIQQRMYFFDKKSLIVRAWKLGEKVNEDEVAEVPIWVQFPKLDLRFWGGRGLSKVASLLGKPIKADKHTKEKKLVNYARVLIEIDITKEIPEKVTFVDEFGDFIEQKVECEWKPIKYTKCKMFVLEEAQCRKGVRREWVRKTTEPPQVPLEGTTTRGETVQVQNPHQGNSFAVLGLLQEGSEAVLDRGMEGQNGEANGELIHAREHG